MSVSLFPVNVCKYTHRHTKTHIYSDIGKAVLNSLSLGILFKKK